MTVESRSPYLPCNHEPKKGLSAVYCANDSTRTCAVDAHTLLSDLKESRLKPRECAPHPKVELWIPNTFSKQSEVSNDLSGQRKLKKIDPEPSNCRATTQETVLRTLPTAIPRPHQHTLPGIH
jgi:hypothetical protein